MAKLILLLVAMTSVISYGYQGKVLREAESNMALRWFPGRQFKNQQEAEKVAQGARSEILISRDTQLRNYVRFHLDVLERAFRELFPDMMHNKASVDFVLDSSGSWYQAFSQLIEEGDHTKYVLILPTALFRDPSLGSSVRFGVLAHEMAHGLLGHTAVDKNIISAVDLKTGESLDLKRVQALREVIYLSSIGGSRFNHELSGIDVSQGVLMDAVIKYIKNLSVHAYRKGDVACGTDLENLWLTRSKYSFSYIDKLSNEFKYPPLESNKVISLMEKTKAYAVACAKKYKLRFDFLASSPIPKRPLAFMKHESINPVNIEKMINKEQNELEMLFQIGERVHSEIRRLIFDHQLEQVEWQSFEDEADEFAAAVLKLIRQRPALMAWELVKVGGDEVAKTCLNAITSGKNIPIGRLVSIHHTPCYRYHRALKFEQDPNFQAVP